MRNKKRILFICVEGFDTPGPSNHLVSALIEDLLNEGFEVHLIQSNRLGAYNELTDNLVGKENLTVELVRRPIIEKHSFVQRYFEEIFYAFRCFFRWRKQKSVDAVFVQSCPTVVFSILLLKIFTKYPIMYSVQDVWPGSAVNSGVLKNRLVISFFRFAQKIAYRYSNILTVVSEDMKRKVIEAGATESKIHTVVNYFDDTTVEEVQWENNRFVKKYNLKQNKFYVQYAGTMGYVFDYMMVINVAEKLKCYSDIEFHMIGQGSQKKKFIKEAEIRNINNIKFFPLEPQEMVSDVYSACSVCLIPLKKGIIGNSVPSKAGLLMACKRPIVNSVDIDSDYFRQFNDLEIGISASNDDPEAVKDAIIHLYSNPEKRIMISERGQAFGKKYYSRSVNTEKFIRLFVDMIKK